MSDLRRPTQGASICQMCVRRIYQTCPIDPVEPVTACSQYRAFAGTEAAPTSEKAVKL